MLPQARCIRRAQLPVGEGAQYCLGGLGQLEQLLPASIRGNSLEISKTQNKINQLHFLILYKYYVCSVDEESEFNSFH